MWAEHPEIAKRWAHEYPNQKKLPMYAHNNKPDGKPSNDGEKPAEKEAALKVLQRALFNNNSQAVLQLMQNKIAQYSPIAKKSNSIIEYLDVPHSDKPVAAGDEHVKPKSDAPKTPENPDPHAPVTDLPALFSRQEKGEPKAHETAMKLAHLFAKHAVVLAPKHRPNTPVNAGLDVAKLQRKIMEDKNKMLYGGNPLPLAEQQKHTKPYPDKAQQARTAAQKAPNIMSNNLMGNVIGNQGPLNSKNGTPTSQQNVTGNQAFGSANRVPGITQYGIV